MVSLFGTQISAHNFSGSPSSRRLVPTSYIFMYESWKTLAYRYFCSNEMQNIRAYCPVIRCPLQHSLQWASNWNVKSWSSFNSWVCSSQRNGSYFIFGNLVLRCLGWMGDAGSAVRSSHPRRIVAGQSEPGRRNVMKESLFLCGCQRITYTPTTERDWSCIRH